MADKQDVTSTSDDGAAPKGTSNDSVGDPKAHIVSADMSEGLQQEIIKIAASALKKSDVAKEIAAEIKRVLDADHGRAWHVVVGRDFGSNVTHGSPGLALTLDLTP